MKRIKVTGKSGIALQGSGESGQASIYLILVLGTVLLASMAFSADVSNMWFHRQQAQTAADAACQAGVLDMLAKANGKAPPAMNFTANIGDPGSNCDSSLSATICQYAKFNGYDGTGGFNAGAVSKSVSWTFPSSVAGVAAPPSGAVAPYLKVVVAENVKTWFMNMVTIPYVKVSASCQCGLSGSVQLPPPLVILEPKSANSLSIHDGASLVIAGGPQLAIQVNSTNKNAVKLKSTTIDTSKGGSKSTGSDIGTAGPTDDPGTGAFLRGSTGHWLANAPAVADPFLGTPSPDKLKAAGLSSTDYVGTKYPHVVVYPEDGCPDTAPANWFNQIDPNSSGNKGCLEFEPGHYTADINIPNATVAIFKPGVYYMDGNLNVTSGEARSAKPCWFFAGKNNCSKFSLLANQWKQTDGVTFYFLKGTMSVSNGSGQMSAAQIKPYLASDLTCDGSVPTSAPTNSLNGNMLVAPCTTKGTYYDTQGDTTDTPGNPGTRGLLVYQATNNNKQPDFGGGASLAFSGSLYYPSATFYLHDAGANNTFVLGEIVANQVEMTGSGVLWMSLAPATSSSGGALKIGFF